MIGLSAAVYCCFQLFCVLLILLYQGMHSSLSVRRKITFNVFYSTFTYVFLFLSRFFTFLSFFILGNVFSSMSQTASRSVQPYLHRSLQNIIRLLCAAPFPLKIALSRGGSGPHLIRGYIWAHTSPQPERHLDRFSRFRRAKWHLFSEHGV